MNCRCMKFWNFMNSKIMVMSPIVIWGCIRKEREIFEHLVHEISTQSCARIVFKFYKMQLESKIHETRRQLMLSHVIAVKKNSNDLEHYLLDAVWNPNISVRISYSMWATLAFANIIHQRKLEIFSIFFHGFLMW